MSIPFKPPLKLLLIDIVGTVMAALGIAALVSDLSGVFPWLANRDVAGVIAMVAAPCKTRIPREVSRAACQ